MGDGQYRWRHDQVLEAIAIEVSEAIRNIEIDLTTIRQIGSEREEAEKHKSKPNFSSNRLAVDCRLEDTVKVPQDT